MANNPKQKRIRQLSDEVRGLKHAVCELTCYADECNRRIARMRSIAVRRRHIAVGAMKVARFAVSALAVVVATFVVLAVLSFVL